MVNRAAAGLIVATLLAPVIAVADDSVTLADLARGDQVRVRLTQRRKAGPRHDRCGGAGGDRRAARKTRRSRRCGCRPSRSRSWR